MFMRTIQWIQLASHWHELTCAMASPPPFSWGVASLPTHTNTWKPESTTNTAKQRTCNEIVTRLHQSICITSYMHLSGCAMYSSITIFWVKVSLAQETLCNLLELEIMILTLVDPAIWTGTTGSVTSFTLAMVGCMLYNRMWMQEPEHQLFKLCNTFIRTTL